MSSSTRYDHSGYDLPATITEEAPGLIRFTFVNPPINRFEPEVFAALRQLVDRMESDQDLKVVIIDSADPDYFIAGLNVQRIGDVPDRPGAAPLIDKWHDLVLRIAHSSVITIASIRGRARGIGNEIALAFDMRFASKERALFSNPEVGFGSVPGGGALDWLPRLVGRSRALEIMTIGDDIDATTAQVFGLVNRAVPDAELDAFVERAARRIAGFDKNSLRAIKRVVNERVAPPSAGDLLHSFREILDTFAWPEGHQRAAIMTELGWGQDTDTELNLPEVLGTVKL
jgi:enoyl-CoA hydratase/carnithine racemase